MKEGGKLSGADLQACIFVDLLLAASESRDDLRVFKCICVLGSFYGTRNVDVVINGKDCHDLVYVLRMYRMFAPK
jgi:hypothetical protein